jgi:hypothetical protein
MTSLRGRVFSASTLSGTLPFAFLLAGCGKKQGADAPAIPLVKHGYVEGGTQPISNSTIQLYAVGTTGDGTAAMAITVSRRAR